MSYQVLARKWRPRQFSELVGQEHVVRALSHALDDDRIHHAFLFTGTRGVGKTTIARIFAKSLNCQNGPTSTPCGECGICADIDAGRFPDLLEIDAASNTGIDNVRELIDNAQYSPSRGRYKVYLIDEVHMLSKAAFNALLKTLEEPPPHVKFLLATTDPQKLPVTVLSRCIKFNLKRLTPEQISGQMRHILAAENIVFDEEAIEVLARAADGSLRDGLSLLDQAIAHGGGRLLASEVHSMLGTVERGQVRVLLDAIAANDAQALLGEIERVAQFAPDFSQVLDEMAGLLHRIQLIQLVGTQNADDDSAFIALATHIDPREVQLYYQIVVTSRRDLPLAPTPRVGFEMALLRMLAFAPADAAGAAPPITRAASAPAPRSSAPPAAPAPAPAPAPAVTHPPAAPVRADRIAEPAPTATPPPVAAALAAASTVPSTPPPSPPAAAVATPAALGEAHPVPDADADADGPLQIEDWAALLQRAGLGGPVGQLAQHAVLLGIEGDTLRLGMQAAHVHLANPDMVAMLEKRISESVARSVRVRIERVSDSGETPAEQRAKATAARQNSAEKAVHADPFVQSLMETYDARIVPGSIHPLEN